MRGQLAAGGPVVFKEKLEIKILCKTTSFSDVGS